MVIEKQIKLNLGSRDRTIAGFKNMDIDPHDGVDYVGDVSDMSRFRDGSIGEIFASNILEHFSHTKTVDVLREWHRVLSHGGSLYLSVPNFRRAVQMYLKFGLCDWVENFLMGDQGYKTAFHYAIFDEAKITDLLLKSGFEGYKFVKLFDFAAKEDCSNLASTHDKQPVCINVIAKKGGNK